MPIYRYNPRDLYASPSLGGLFLRRLQRLLRIRRDQWEELADEGRHLMDRAIYSTYCDAIGLVEEEEVGEEARKLLRNPDLTRRPATNA